jgi:Polyketide cyclase / dehydrase and lipid transport
VVRFTAVVDSPASPERTWGVLTHWPSHGRWVPLTDVRVLTPSGSGVGARFVGRTGLGPLGFDDPMEVVEWREPVDGLPGRCRVVKQGRVVLGETWFEVAPRPSGGSTVTWTEEVEIVPVRLTRPFGRLVSALGRIAFTRSLRAMARELA